MSKPSKQIGSLLNHHEVEDATLVNISHTDIQYFDGENFSKLTNEELDEIAHIGPITFAECPTESGKFCRRTYRKNYFTVKELVKTIVDFETYNRQYKKWFGGIDTHHIYFEYLVYDKDKRGFVISWGS